MVLSSPSCQCLAIILCPLVDECRRIPDLRDLPSLVPDEWRNATAQVIEAELGARIAKALRIIDSGSYDTSTNEISGLYTLFPYLYFHFF
jgi:hypothetical protein